MPQNRELSFGTAGVRAPVGPAPDQMNVLSVTRITAGVAAWLARTVGQERNQHPVDSVFSQEGPLRVAVGYDSRYGSMNFATTTAEVFAGAGFEVTLLPTPGPTQLIPWLVRHRDLDAGVQITASHNPAGDNGYKVYLADGAQLASPADREIEEFIRAIEDPLEVPRVMVRPTTDQLRRYIDHVVSLVDPGQGDRLRVNNERAALKVAFTAMHGVGGRALNQALQAAGFAQTFPVTRQYYPDPTFPTVDFPNPEEPGATDLLLEKAAETEADILIALDPDADRCAVGYRQADGSHVMLRGDDLGPLLATRLVPRHTGKGPAPVVAASDVSSQLLSVIAEDKGWDYQQTKTGFKHLVRAAEGRPGDLVFAYEEAIGTCPAPDLVADKDGIATALVTCAWAAELKALGLTLGDELSRLHKRYGTYTGTQVSVRTLDPDALIENLRNHPPVELAGVPVKATELSDGYGIVLSGSSPDSGITVRALARPSGTEYKAKFYLETKGDPALLDRLKEDVEKVVETL